MRYTDIKQVRTTKQGKQHDNERMRGDKIPTIRGTGENTPFATQSRKKEQDKDHNMVNIFLYIKNLLFVAECYVSKELSPLSVNWVSESWMISIQFISIGQDLVGKSIQVLLCARKPWDGIWRKQEVQQV